LVDKCLRSHGLRTTLRLRLNCNPTEANQQFRIRFSLIENHLKPTFKAKELGRNLHHRMIFKQTPGNKKSKI
jgi:hypothetical protein